MSEAESPYLTFNETIRLLAEFLEVAIHDILCVRQVYPSDLFEQRKKYDVPIWRSRHPDLTDYITDVVVQTMEEVSKGTVSKVILAIQDDSVSPPDPLEHFIFDILYFVDTSLMQAEAARNERPLQGHGTHAEIQLRLRAFLLKLAVCDASLVSLPQDLTWTTFLELRDPNAAPSTEAAKKAGVTPSWIPAPATTFRDFPASARDAPPTDVAPSKLVPLRSEGLGMVQLQLMVEEHPRKLDLLDAKVRDKDGKGKGKAVE